MSKKNTIIAWIIILAWLFLPSLSVALKDADLGWLDNDYARITDMDYKAVVVDEPDGEGKIVVTERITFDVHAASRDNGFWELWRDLCESTIDGVKVHYKVNSVKQIMPDGTEVVWQESPQLYWNDYDYVSYNTRLGPGKWYHSEGPYSEYLRQYECLLFYVDDLYREEVTFEIEYEMYNAVLRYNDCSDLYIAMYSGDTTKYLESFSAEILIPNENMPSAGNYSFTTYGTKEGDFQVEESATKNPGYYTFYFDLTEDDLKFSSYNEYIEFDLVAYGDDKHVFSEYASVNDYYDDDVLDVIWDEQAAYRDEYVRYKSIKTVVCSICVLLAMIAAVVGITKVCGFKKKYPFYTTKQTLDTYRDIPSDLDPKLAAALVFCKDKKTEDDSGVYSALLLSLARKKYIELRELATDVLIILNKDATYEFIDRQSTQTLKSFFDPLEHVAQNSTVGSLEPLTICEKYYLNVIKHHAKHDCISMSELQDRISIDYANTRCFSENIKRAVPNCGVGMGYFQKADWLEPKKKLSSLAKTYLIFGAIFAVINLFICRTRLDLAFGGFIFLAVSCVATGIYLKSQAHKYVLLTEYGEREYTKWRGLYNFLKSDTLIKERTVIELPLWEKYLVYATAFGISEKVIQAIKIHCPEAMTVEESKSIVHSTYCRSGRIHSSGRRFHSSVHSGAHGSFNGGSYGGGSFSGSHGYGGGGRGGGGGGGGH